MPHIARLDFYIHPDRDASISGRDAGRGTFEEPMCRRRGAAAAFSALHRFPAFAHSSDFSKRGLPIKPE